MNPMTKKLILLVAASACLFAQSGPRPELQTLHVQGNVYLLAGAGGNIIVQTGQQGTLVVDTGLADRSDDVLAAIRKLTGKPIQYIINTHVHPDHTGETTLFARRVQPIRARTSPPISPTLNWVRRSSHTTMCCCA